MGGETGRKQAAPGGRRLRASTLLTVVLLALHLRTAACLGPEQEKQLLLAFKREGALSHTARLGSWLPSRNLCSWAGVTCADDGRVASLDMEPAAVAGIVMWLAERGAPASAFTGDSCGNGTSPDGLQGTGCACRRLQRCAAGLLCRHESDTSVSEAADDTNAAGRCVECQPGDYCPAGSSDMLPHLLNVTDSNSKEMAELAEKLELGGDSETLLRRGAPRAVLTEILACPPGYFCPEPSTRHECPPGEWCPVGSTAPKTCDIPTLLRYDPQARIPSRVATRPVMFDVVLGQQLISGNSCPAGSTHPGASCPAGWFCPAPALQHQCPAGFYCPPGSTKPLRCPWSAACPAGSATPRVAPGPLALGVLLASLLVAMLYVALRWPPRHRARVEPLNDNTQQEQSLSPGVDDAPPPCDGVQNREEPVLLSLAQGRGRHMADVVVEGLQLRLAGGDVILDDINGSFSNSQLHAIMGSSGCGKTSLLLAIAGRSRGRLCGTVRINGVPATPACCRRSVGLVPQDDVLYGDLTVEESLWYQAAFRLPASVTRAQKERLVDESLELLSLQPLRGAIVGDVLRRGISGGQRKRVSIGMELVALPSVLCLDEPTSGLDAASALLIVSAVKQLCASHGVCGIMVIHQPRVSVFKLCSQVLLLDSAGRQVFLGSPARVRAYFLERGFRQPAGESTPNFVLDVLQGQTENEQGVGVAELCDLWARHGSDEGGVCSSVTDAPVGREESMTPEPLQGVRWPRRSRAAVRAWLLSAQSFGGSAGWALERSWRQWRRGVPRLLADYGTLSVAAVVLAAIHRQTLPSASTPFATFAMVIAVFGVFTCVASLHVLGNHQAVQAREASAGHNIIAACIGKLAWDSVDLAGRVLLFGSTYAAIVPGVQLRSLLPLLALEAWACSGLGYAVSAVCPASYMVIAGAVLPLLTAGLFAGVYPLTLHTMSAHVLGRIAMTLSFARWAMEFIVLEYYRGLPHQHRLVGGTAISEVGFCGLGSVALNGSALSEAAASASLQAAVLQAAGAINATGGGGWGDIAVTWGAGNSSAAGAANDSLSVPGLLARGLGALQSSPSAALTSSPEYQAAAAAVSVLQTAVKIDTWEPCVLARTRALIALLLLGAALRVAAVLGLGMRLQWRAGPRVGRPWRYAWHSGARRGRALPAAVEADQCAAG